MSATLDAAPVARYLGECPIVRSEGRLFDLAITYQPYSAAPLEKQVASALQALLNQSPSGDILVFLTRRRGDSKSSPGMPATSRQPRSSRFAAARRSFTRGAGSRRLPGPAPQSDSLHQCRRKLHHGGRRDSGHRQRPGANGERFALDRSADAQVARISKASATQRAGRAARTAPGRVIRLLHAR